MKKNNILKLTLAVKTLKKSIQIIMVSFFILLCLNLFAENNIKLKDEKTSLKVKENTYTKLRVTSSLNNFTYINVNTPKGIFTELIVPDYGVSNKIGNPKLPVLRKLIEIPQDANIKIKIISYNVEEYNLNDLGIIYPIIPKQPSIPKNKKDSIIFQYNKSAYTKNEYQKALPNLVTVNILGVMRGTRLARLNIAPVLYNPVTNTIKIYNNIDVEINFVNANIAKTLSLKKKTCSPYFQATNKQILNYKSLNTREVNTKYPVKYVIVSDPMFQATLQSFIQWKTKKGFTVIEAYTDDPGVGTTTTSIKSYLKNLYDSGTEEYPSPSFVLFVGDIAQIPAFNGNEGSHVTDLYYCEYTGDILPEVYYGRFSATSISELQPQIDKTLEYEQYLMPDPSFLNEVVMIAGVDASNAPTYGNGQINYGTTNYFNTAHGLTSHTYLYPASDDPGASADIIQNISDGVAFANYTAHGDWDQWYDPSFTVSDISGLLNAHKYPLMVGNACLTNKFDEPACFGEALLRAENKGALGYIGGSNSTYWDEDYYWGIGYGTVANPPPSYAETGLGAYDRTFHDNGETFGDWFVTQGQMVSAGNLAVTESGSSYIDYYWEIYHLMGDPSLMIYFSEPPVLNVSYNSLLPLAATSFTVTTEPYTYVAISMNGVLHGAALTDTNGIADINITPFTNPGTADVVATKQNRQPFIGTVTVATPSGPYVIYNNNQINDDTGNNNGFADTGENIKLDITLENIGVAVADSVYAVLSTGDTYITINDNTQFWGDITEATTSTQNNAYEITISDSIPDNHIVHFNLTIKDKNDSTWSSDFSINVNAPNLSINNLIIDDIAGGNGNGKLEPGETADIIILTKNNGHCDAENTIGNLSTTNFYVAINNYSYNLNTLSVSETDSAIFNITVSTSALMGSIADFNYSVTSALYNAQKTFIRTVGIIDEDFETDGFSKFNWDTTDAHPWIITDVNPYEGIYCAKSGNISDGQTSELLINFDAVADDSISFFRKVSSEEDYDFLEFYVDGNLISEWSGEQSWSRVSFPVPAGNHTFKWLYSKDNWSSSGSDCAWIDNIIFPPVYNTLGINNNKDNEETMLKCFPNPFVNSTNISYTLTKPSSVTIKIYNLLGEEKNILLNKTKKEQGTYTITFNASDFKAGIYYCVLTTDYNVITKKLMVIKH